MVTQYVHMKHSDAFYVHNTNEHIEIDKPDILINLLFRQKVKFHLFENGSARRGD